MYHIQQSDVFSKWFDALKDREARARILTRIRRLSLGNPGDFKQLGVGVNELRINYGPGYRVYFARRGEEVIILLAGGDKRTQSRDIEMAVRMAKEL